MARRRSIGALAGAVAAAAALVLGTAACGGDDSDSGGAEGEITLNLAYVTTAEHPYGLGVDKFVKEVDEASDGRIKINPQPSYPQSEIQLLSDVRGGSVDMATISTAIWDSAGINSFQALQAPFLITNYELMGKVIDGEIGKAMTEDASQQAGDATVLAIHEGGLRKPIGKRPLVSVENFRGAKIRAVQSNVLATGLRALGAEADPIPLPEVYQALDSGTVQGLEANLGLIATGKYYEVAKNVSWNLNLWPFPTALTVNNAKFQALSEEDQKIITDAAAKLPGQSIEIVSASSDLPQQLVNCGVTFRVATPAQVRALEARARNAYGRLSQDATTGEFLQQIQDLKADSSTTEAPKPPTKKTGECQLS